MAGLGRLAMNTIPRCVISSDKNPSCVQYLILSKQGALEMMADLSVFDAIAAVNANDPAWYLFFWHRRRIAINDFVHDNVGTVNRMIWTR